MFFFQMDLNILTVNMAMSKHVPDMKEQLNLTNLCKDLKITIPEEEIKAFCWIKKEHAISIEIINHLLGGPNMDYDAMNIQGSFQCFQFTANSVLQYLKDSKEILFFENRKTTKSDVVIICTKQNKSKGVREHIKLLAIIRLTIMMTPKVGFFRFFDIKGW